jgi:hypothetical protein
MKIKYMKTIEVSDEMYNSLIELSKELNTQDHRATAMPYFFQIRTQKEVAVPEGCGTECWVLDDSKIETAEEINNEIFDYKDGNVSLDFITKLNDWEKEAILEGAGWRKVNYDFVDHFENAFLTAKACKEHIQSNKHHYDYPVDYLSHAFRNPELELVLKFLCELTKGELHK